MCKHHTTSIHQDSRLEYLAWGYLNSVDRTLAGNMHTQWLVAVVYGDDEEVFYIIEHFAVVLDEGSHSTR